MHFYMPAPLRIHLTPVQEAQLRELETNPVVPHKVRRRARAIRLAAQGRLLEMGYRWKRTRYVPTGKPREEEVEGSRRPWGRRCGRGGGGLPAGVQPAPEPGGGGVAAGEGVFDAPEALRERGGAEGAVAEALERLRERMGQGVLQGLCVGTSVHVKTWDHPFRMDLRPRGWAGTHRRWSPWNSLPHSSTP